MALVGFVPATRAIYFSKRPPMQAPILDPEVFAAVLRAPRWLRAPEAVPRVQLWPGRASPHWPKATVEFPFVGSMLRCPPRDWVFLGPLRTRSTIEEVSLAPKQGPRPPPPPKVSTLNFWVPREYARHTKRSKHELHPRRVAVMLVRQKAVFRNAWHGFSANRQICQKGR